MRPSSTAWSATADVRCDRASVAGEGRKLVHCHRNAGLGRTALRAETSIAGHAAGRAAQSRRATTPYSRPSGATTLAQRASVQGRPCVYCGRVSTPQRAGHKTALVREHYQTGSIDRTRMRSTESVQPECIKCSAQEGAEMSRYSREMRRQLDDRH